MGIRSLVLSFLLLQIVAAYVITEDVSKVSNKVTSEDVFDIEGFLNGYGYPFENHEVTTEDGYILGVHRIPHGKKEAANIQHNKTKPAVLIMHGLLANSVDFFIMGPNQSLAMLFADLGYDVWLGNSRGNTWSRRHISLDPDVDASFWDFSFHEFGVYDDAAMIDYILNNTGNEKVSYIGHSQGTTQFFALASMRPEYNEKIAIMSALAPVAFLGNASSPLVHALNFSQGIIDQLVDYFNVTEFLSHNNEVSSFLESFCGEDSKYQDLCLTTIFLLCGFDYEQIDRSSFHLIFKTLPAGISVKQLQHFLQEIKSGYFRQFDYGEESNLEIYKRSSPPDYDITAITAPVALHYSANDWIVSISDLDRFASLLPNIAKKHLMEYKKFSHLDFLFSKDAISLCYLDVADVMSTYTGVDSLR